MNFVAIAQTCAPTVHEATLAAVVQVESSYDPLAIGINHRSQSPVFRKPKTKPEAVATADWLIEQGYNIDMGLGQINSANLDWLGMTVEQVFDPCQNLTAAGRILTENYTRALRKYSDQQQALQAALSAYNTGNFVGGFGNGYVQKVKVAAGQKQTIKVPALAGATVPVAGQDIQQAPDATPRNSFKGNVFADAQDKQIQQDHEHDKQPVADTSQVFAAQDSLVFQAEQEQEAKTTALVFE